MDQDLVDRWVPIDLLQGDPTVRRQARLSLWLVVALTPVLLLCALASSLVRGPNVLALELVIGASVLVSAVPVLRGSGSVTLAAVVVMVGSLGPVVAVCWSGYGLLSPAITALMLAPVVGFVLGGARVGVGMAGVAIGVIEALYLAPYLGRPPPLVPAGPIHPWLFAQVQVVVVGMITGFLYFYDGAWRQAMARSDADRDALEEARDLALGADALKDRFLANMSHELRTPLSAILGYTEMLLEDESDPDLQRIHRAGQHLLALVDDVLDLARIEQGRIVLHMEAVDVGEVVTDAVEAVQPLAAEGVALRTELDGHRVFADPARLRQVLINLLVNACKFTDAGEVRVVVRGDVRQVAIDVIDTGRGMTTEERQRCFEPFEQGALAEHDGVGLGLAITQRLVLLMGGQVTVQSAPGKGSTFTVHLRTSSPSTPQLRTPEVSAAPS